MLDKFEREQDVNERKRLHCSECARITIHNLEARCKGSWEEIVTLDEFSVYGGSTYSIFRCGGCDNVCYETVLWDSENGDFDDNSLSRTQQYPAPMSAHFNFNTESTPLQLNDILDEMLYALAGSKMTLATIGLRLAVEFIVKDRKCAGRNLQQKIDDLHNKGMIEKDQQQLLQRIRLKGNQGAHEAKGMKAGELIAGMSIIEGLLEKLYNGPERHKSTIARAQQMLKDDDDEDSETNDRPLLLK